MSNNVKPTKKQVAAVNGIMEGKATRRAMIEAGYSEVSSRNPKINLMERTGVQAYIKKFDKATKQKFGMNLGETLVNVYTDGLAATKPMGKNAIEHPDHPTRYLFANKLSEFLGWSKMEILPQNNNQFNFFNISEKTRGEFDSKLKDFLKQSYYKE